MAQAVKIALVGRECVACGCCEKVCPKNAIHVRSGIIAQVDGEKCVGCGRCPAAVISVVQRKGDI